MLEIIAEIIEYSIALVLVLECNTLYQCAESVSPMTLIWYMFVVVIGGLFLIWYYGRKDGFSIKKYREEFVVLVGYYVFLFIFLYFNCIQFAGNWKNLIIDFAGIVPIYLVLFWILKKQNRLFVLLKKYESIVFVIAFVGLVFIVLSNIMPEKIPSSGIATRWSHTGDIRTLRSYFNFYCSDDYKDIGNIRIFRNFGFMPEGPMYGIPLIAALNICLFLDDSRYRIVKAFVMSLAVLSSFAYLSMFMCVLTWGVFVLTKVKKQYLKWILPLAFLSAVLIGCIFIVFKSRFGNYSFSIHLEDYVLGWRCFKDHPIFGTGFDNYAPIQEYMSPERFATNKGHSNSIMAVLAEGGVMLGILCMVPFFVGMLQIFNPKDICKKISFCYVGFFCIYVLAVFEYRYLLLIFVALGWSLIDIKNISIYLSEDGNFDIYDRSDKNDTNDTPATKENDRSKRYLLKGIIVLLGAIVSISSLISEKFWKNLFYFFKVNGLLLGDSAERFPILVMVILGLGIYIKHMCVNKRPNNAESWARILWPICLAVVVYCCTRKYLYSLVTTFLYQRGMYYGIYECLYLLACFIAMFTCFFGIGYVIVNRKKISTAVPILSIVLLVGIVLFPYMQINNDFSIKTMCTDDMAQIIDECDGGVYVTDYPIAFGMKSDNINYGYAKDSIFTVKEDATIISAISNTNSALYGVGYKSAKLSDSYLIFTNSDKNMQLLEDRGYQLSDNYCY